MTREELTSKVLESNSNHFLIEACTGFGKTVLAMKRIAKWYKPGEAKILILVPQLVNIDTWKNEISKFGYTEYNKDITFSAYASIHKYVGNWDILICDEAHHLTERCRNYIINNYRVKHFIGLSATIKEELRGFLKNIFPYIDIYQVPIQSAIADNQLPEPVIYLVPLALDNTENIYTLEKKNKGKMPTIIIDYKDKWNYRNYAGTVRMRCTARQYMVELDNKIEFYKRHKRDVMVRILRSDRLKFLAVAKHKVIEKMLKDLKNNRVLVFSSGIEESSRLNCPCVNSKVGIDNLDKFNEGRINHIAAVNQLDEGVNLTSCQVGIFQMINASKRLAVQRTGRILRHKSPIIIIPYYKYTREEEIVTEWMNDYPDHLKYTVQYTPQSSFNLNNLAITTRENSLVNSL